jgi:tetratricopeptide (TPR) repeat protein
MTPSLPDDHQKEAFRLFENGRYLESLETCNRLLEKIREPALDVLAATNLYYLGRLEEAEVYFRDLVQKMPDSSYVHSYLAKVLEGRGDDHAIAEYASAVRLDPDNQDALRSYAAYLLSRRDFRGALPVLKRLAGLGNNPGDRAGLVRVLIETGAAKEARATALLPGWDHDHSREYIDALCTTGDYRTAAAAALSWYEETHDPAILRVYLDALSHDDLPSSLAAYASFLKDHPDPDILLDYTLILKANGEYLRALAAVKKLLGFKDRGPYRLIECEIYAALGDQNNALLAFEHLIREELSTKNDLTDLGTIIREYRDYLQEHCPGERGLSRFLEVVAQDPNVASLLETARFYEARGNLADARSWYYRAYRADYLNGGLSYARFLSGTGDERESEKVMLYILSQVKKTTDLGRVAGVITDKNSGMLRMKRLVTRLIRHLNEKRLLLSSHEKEYLAIALHRAATIALDEADYEECKYDCLCGIDVLPAHSLDIRLDDFVRLFQKCKDRTIAEQPAMHAAPVKQQIRVQQPVQLISDQLELSGTEQKIIGFLRSYQKATEMDLRKLLGTRRVSGIMNRLIRKASDRGIMLVEKKGMSADGEVYEYTGT